MHTRRWLGAVLTALVVVSSIGVAAGPASASVNVVRGLWLPTGWTDLESTPSGDGYWVLASNGAVQGFGDAITLGGTGTLRTGEVAVSMSRTTTGDGYWIFTDWGRVITRGDAVSYGDASALALVGPIRDSIATASGRGYFMVAADGGVFTFGDARFSGSMGATPLNAPVESLVPDPDGSGYWLVASDGGVFAFDAAFHGSMASVALNAPVEGMVPLGDGYVLVAGDGGAFVFSDRPFLGSLGSTPPTSPVVAITTRPAGDGYRMLTRSGQVFGFGAASDLGSPLVPGPECARTLIVTSVAADGSEAIRRVDTESGAVAPGFGISAEHCGQSHGFISPVARAAYSSIRRVGYGPTHDGSFLWYRTDFPRDEVHVIDSTNGTDRVVASVPNHDDRVGGLDMATGRLLLHTDGGVTVIDVATGVIIEQIPLPTDLPLVDFSDWSSDSRYVGLTITNDVGGQDFTGWALVADLAEGSLTMVSRPSWSGGLYPPRVVVLANGDVAALGLASFMADIGTLSGRAVRTLDLTSADVLPYYATAGR